MSNPYLVQEELAREEEAPQQEGDQNLQESSEKERRAPTSPPSARKTSIARNLALHKSDPISLAKRGEVVRAMNAILGLLTSSDEGESDLEEEKGVSRRVSNLKPVSQPEENFASSPRLPSRTAGKRAFENSGNDAVFQGKEKKRSDEVNGEDGVGDEILRDIKAKSYVDRVLRDLDAEIELLKGISYYHTLCGRCAPNNSVVLVEFVKNLMGVDAPADQLIEAIKTLEKKYAKISRNQEALELADKIWGTGSETNFSDNQYQYKNQEGLGVKAVQEQDESEKKMYSVDGQEKVNTEGVRPRKALKLGLERKNLEGRQGQQSQNDLSKFPYLESFLKSENSNWNVLTRLMSDATLKRGVGLMTSSSMKELDQTCKKLQDIEVDAFMLRTTILGEIVELMGDAVESSSSSAP